MSLHFPKNLRGRAAEHRIADLRVLIVSAKLLVGPSTTLGTHRTRPTTPSATLRALHSIIPRESTGNRSRGSEVRAPTEPGPLRSVQNTCLRPRIGVAEFSMHLVRVFLCSKIGCSRTRDHLRPSDSRPPTPTSAEVFLYPWPEKVQSAPARCA